MATSSILFRDMNISEGLKELPKSDSTPQKLKAMVKEGILPAQALLNCRAPKKQEVPLVANDY